MVDIGDVIDFMESRGAKSYLVLDDLGIEQAKEGEKIIFLYDNYRWMENSYYQLRRMIQDQQLEIEILRMSGRAVFKFSSGGIIQLRAFSSTDKLRGLDFRGWLYCINF